MLEARDPRRDGETEEEARARRERESLMVESRMVDVRNSATLQRELDKAGERLVVLEIASEVVCDTGITEVADPDWKQDGIVDLAPCERLKHSMQRCARECPDVVFLKLVGDESEEARALCEEQGVTSLPTLRFYRSKELLWEVEGVQGAEKDLGEGVLYFGDYAAQGEKATAHVPELTSRDDMKLFVQGAGKEIAVIDFSTEQCEPCIHIFPAVLALAKNMKGHVRFARIVGDANSHTQALMKEFDVVQVPTFLFFKEGALIERYVGSSRGDLIGQILKIQGLFGEQPLPRANIAHRHRMPVPKPQRKKSGQDMW